MNKKYIIDICCGARMFWFDKKQANTIFMDNRIRLKGFKKARPNREIKPDLVADFKNIPFEDETFYLVVMDPPHIISSGETSNMTMDYGYLKKETWKDEIKKGFDEGMRVLKWGGVLIFKWNETSIKRKEILSILGTPPLFGHPNGSKIKTNWFCFMKIPRAD